MKTIIVAGCARSGLTLMMQIFYRAGFPCYGSWPAFEDRGIGQIHWDDAQGKVVKSVDTCLRFPPTGDYYVIRMRRDLTEQAKSTIKFAKAGGIKVKGGSVSAIKKSLFRDYKKIHEWGQRQSGYIVVNFEDLITVPSEVIQAINKAFNINMPDEAKKAVIQRSTDCYDGLLEACFF